MHDSLQFVLERARDNFIIACPPVSGAVIRQFYNFLSMQNGFAKLAKVVSGVTPGRASRSWPYTNEMYV
eukprot:3616251-Pleurochrysis_carterae.AAC.2